MRQIIILIVVLFIPILAIAQMDIPGDGGNPKAIISEEVGITSITINYSRPGVKGREGKIWGRVVANGFGSYNFLTASQSSEYWFFRICGPCCPDLT